MATEKLAEQTEHARIIENKSSLSEDIAIVALVLFNLGIIALDFYSHPHAGVADLERRRQLTEAIGVLANHIGNYGFSSCLAMGAVLTKHTLYTISEHPVATWLTKRSFQLLLASILALNGAIETVMNMSNQQAFGDVGAAFTGVLLGAVSAELAIHRLKKSRRKTAQTP